MSNTMKAVVYQGKAREIKLEDVPLPKLDNPSSVIVKITTSAICGSDLHMYEARTAAEGGLRFGHENMGIIEEVGSGVTRLKKGDRVVMPFNVACGSCRNCEANDTGFCLTANPGNAGSAYGYVAMGGWDGGQTEYILVPWADFNCLVLPPGKEMENDFILLADVLPTGYHGVKLSGMEMGDSVVVFGAGPVGQMAGLSAKLLGASQIYLVDRVPERLQLGQKEYGAIPINLNDGDPTEQILKLRNGELVDRTVDCVGYQAQGPDGQEQHNYVLNRCVQLTRARGGIGVPGLYLPSDPGANDEDSKKGIYKFPIGDFFAKGLKMEHGQCNVKRYDRPLRDLIVQGKLKPSFIVSKEISLDGAVDAYAKFSERAPGYSKVVIHAKDW